MFIGPMGSFSEEEYDAPWTTGAFTVEFFIRTIAGWADDVCWLGAAGWDWSGEG
jgi:hypothetical protein